MARVLAAAGFSPHTGWAALVVAGGPPQEPAVLTRSRVWLLADELPREVYHATKGMGSAEAAALISRVEESARQGAALTLRSARTEATENGYELRAAAVAGMPGRAPRSLGQIQRVHALMHAAEGDLFREAIAEGAALAGLKVVRFVQGEAAELAGAKLSLAPGQVRERVAAWGRPLGPPWGADEKAAATAAWLALLSVPREP
jgi:hypothetical protein